MELAAGPTWINCPQCKASVPSYDGYVTWCDQCNWNLQPQKDEPDYTVFGRVYNSLGKRQSKSLFQEVITAKRLRSGLTLSRILAILIALIVNTITLAIAAVGIVWIVQAWPDIISLKVFGGLLCLGLAWLLWPNVGVMPPYIMPRNEFPTLYLLADRIAEQLNAPKVDGITIDWQFNAAFGQKGYRRRRILQIGLPLWTILENQERVALLSHELAHSVNGDPNRQFLIGSAVDTLARWHWVLAQGEGMSVSSSLLAYLASIFAILLSRLLSLIPQAGAYGLSYLLFRDGQRAEYRADYLATTVSGTAAMLGLLDKLHFTRTFNLLVQKITLYQKDKDFFVELRKRITEVPPRELERIKRLSEVEMSRLDVTHPPTLYRINFLSAQPQLGKPEIMSPAEFEQLERETAALQPAIQKQVVKAYHAGLVPR